MNDERLTDELATRIMGWRPAPGRYLKADRNWRVRWRFQPLNDLGNAFELLGQATDHYTISCELGIFTVEMRRGFTGGKATGDQLARTISLAVASLLGLDIGNQKADQEQRSLRGKEGRS